MKYPDCTLIDCDQHTPEWFDVRKGNLTASQFGDWLTKTGKVSDKARLAAASKVLAEFAGYPDPPPFVNADMKRGIELEEDARQLFMSETGLVVDQIGFAKSKHGFFGCSPDGLILDSGEGLEIKVPRASKLIQYISNNELPYEYKLQVHGSMAVTGARKWHFFAWHPGLPYLHIEVKRDKFTEEVFVGLKSYSNFYKALAENMSNAQLKQSKGAAS